MANISLKVHFLGHNLPDFFGPSIVRSIAFEQGMRTVKRYTEAHLNFLEFA